MLTQCLADLLGGAAPPIDVALMGPRGNGMTVRNWFDRVCREAGRIDTVWLSPSRIRSGQALADVLLPVSVIRKTAAQDLTDWMTARCRRTRCRPGRRSAHARATAANWCSTSARESAPNAPLLLVLAGTPGAAGASR